MISVLLSVDFVFFVNVFLPSLVAGFHIGRPPWQLDPARDWRDPVAREGNKIWLRPWLRCVLCGEDSSLFPVHTLARAGTGKEEIPRFARDNGRANIRAPVSIVERKIA